MRQYEMTYLISDQVSENEINKITGKVGGYINQAGDKVAKEEIWKRRKLAYPIKKQEFATYVTINFEIPGEQVRSFEQQVRLSPEIIRHLILIKDYGAEELTLTAEEIADTEAIEEAIGSEKSFEVVEGETEESRDLQAIRDQEANVTEKSETINEETEKATEIEVKPEKVEEDEPAKQPKSRAKKSTDNKGSEADRLAKLDEEIDSILKDEL